MFSVSVAMATYNGSRYIREQLASLASQSCVPTELVITDDSSDDGTLELASDFARDAPFPMRLYRNPKRLGYRANFMRAASLCRSDLIAFCDQDDVWYRRKIEACAECFHNPDVLLTYHNALVTTDSGDPIGKLDAHAAPQPLNPPMSMRPWLFGLGFTLVFRRSLPPLPELWVRSVDHVLHQPLGHDQWFFFLASVLGTVAYLEEPQAAYRQHGVNAYGWIGEVKTDTRALTRLCSANGADNTAALEAACRGRADILAEAAKELTGTLGERAIAGERLYRNLEGLYAARRAVYTATEPEDRFEAFLTILRCGGYKKNSVWNFHPRNLLKDASLGVLVGHRLKRTASAPSS